MVRVTYGAAEAGAPRRHPNLALAFALIAAALVACVGIVTYAKSTNALAPVETFQMTKLGTEYMVSEGEVWRGGRAGGQSGARYVDCLGRGPHGAARIGAAPRSGQALGPQDGPERAHFSLAGRPSLFVLQTATAWPLMAAREPLVQ
jgi:hypothetical protein